MTLLLFQYTFERILTFVCKFFDRADLGLRDLVGIDSGHTHAVLMNMEHNTGGFGMRFVKDLLQDLNHEFHRCVVVVQQDAFVERRFFGSRLLFGAPLGDNFAVTIVAATSAVALACFD
jgi:hypothetical protein